MSDNLIQAFLLLYEEFLVEEYGKRCEEFDADCVNCQVWEAFDFLRNNR